jgi:hypothetical protein
MLDKNKKKVYYKNGISYTHFLTPIFTNKTLYFI